MTAGTGEFLQRAAVGYLQTLAVEKVKEIADGLKSETARSALHGIVGCAGAAAVGSDCGAGAMGGAASVVLGNLLNAVANTSNENLPQHEKEARINLIESVVAGITTGIGGDAVAARVASRLELENNQVSLPQGIVKMGAAAASLGQFMAENGASYEDIQKAQTELIEMTGTEVPRPASQLLKSWAIVMGAAPALGAGTATAASIAAGGVIGGTSNALVQLTLNGEQEMSKTDVLIAIATGAATQGRSIIATASTNASGAALGAVIKGEDVTNAAIAAVSGAALGAQAGKIITKSAAGLVTDAASGTAGSLTGSFVSEFVSSKIQSILNIEQKNEENK